MPGTTAVNITEISAKIRPLIKRTGIARTISGESTSPKRDITMIIMLP
jgi:hypothetical protein